MARDLPTPHDLVTSFVSGLSDFLTTFSGPRERETFTVTINVATGASQAWTVDIDCVLVCVYGIPAGTTFSVARNKAVGNEASVANAILVRQLILFAQQSAAGVPLHNIRIHESFRAGDKIWVNNGGAAAITVNLLFEA